MLHIAVWAASKVALPVVIVVLSWELLERIRGIKR